MNDLHPKVNFWSKILYRYIDKDINTLLFERVGKIREGEKSSKNLEQRKRFVSNEGRGRARELSRALSGSFDGMGKTRNHKINMIKY